MLSRLVLTLIGLACASAVALVFLPVAVIVDPLVQQVAGQMPADHWFDILSSLAQDDFPDETAAALFQLIWLIGMLVCVAPVTIVALIGAVSRSSSFLFHAGLTGLLAAAMPWLLRASRFHDRNAHMSSAEAHLTAILFLTGAIAGTVYWLISARGEQRPAGRGWMSNHPSE